MKKILIFCFSFFILHSSFAQLHDTTIYIGRVNVDFVVPSGPVNGVILVLPGWNLSRTSLCTKTSFCQEAMNKGYILVLPDMLKSVYSSAIFPETRIDWRHYPTLHWITDSLIPFCQKKYKLFTPGAVNFLFGVSTGGRGVALIAENTGTLFLAGAALSGDYDQTTMPGDRLMTGYYGPYSQFKERWEGPDNPALHSDKLKIPLYLAHGQMDPVVPCQQTLAFSKKIMDANPALGHLLQLCDTCGHNYGFWNSQTEAVFRFFEKNKGKNPGNR